MLGNPTVLELNNSIVLTHKKLEFLRYIKLNACITSPLAFMLFIITAFEIYTQNFSYLFCEKLVCYF